MKTTAYVFDLQTGQYMKDLNGSLKVIDIRDALELRDEAAAYRKEIKSKMVYMTRNQVEEERVRLVPKSATAPKSPHFSYPPEGTPSSDQCYDETFSHESAIDVLSEFQSLRLCAKGHRPFTFNFTKVLREHRLELPNGRVFIPDLLCYFDEESHPAEYARWGGKLAIEVTNTHPCEEGKLKEFELCNIPIFEFKITESRKYLPEKNKGVPDTLNERDKHKAKLKGWLSGDIWVELILDPISTELHEKRVRKFESKVSGLEADCMSLTHEVNHLKSEIEDSSFKIQNLNSVIIENRQAHEKSAEFLTHKMSGLNSLNLELENRNTNLVKELDTLKKVLVAKDEKMKSAAAGYKGTVTRLNCINAGLFILTIVLIFSVFF